MGAPRGGNPGTFLDAVYFSAVTYTSLGYGDLTPLGPVRTLVGVETVIGLILIGWTASFTYLEMQKFWDLHPKRGHRRHSLRAHGLPAKRERLS